MYRILKHIVIPIFFTLTLVQSVTAQNGFFQVEFEKFSPDAQQMITMMEGNPTEPFDAPDVTGTIQKLEDYQGQYLLLWFWDVQDELCQSQVDGFNLMHQFFENEVQVLGFTYDNADVTTSFLARRAADFPIIPNSFKLGELRYGSELGQGRVFLIGKDGVVIKAIPRQFFEENNNSFSILRGLIKELTP